MSNYKLFSCLLKIKPDSPILGRELHNFGTAIKASLSMALVKHIFVNEGVRTKHG